MCEEKGRTQKKGVPDWPEEEDLRSKGSPFVSVNFPAEFRWRLTLGVGVGVGQRVGAVGRHQSYAGRGQQTRVERAGNSGTNV